MGKFRVIFCGTPETAVPSLRALVSDPAFEVALVVTQPDKPKGRGMRIQPSPVKIEAERWKLPIFQPHDINTELPAYLTLHSTLYTFHFLVAVAYGQLLSREILALPTIAPVNLHSSLLPRWRGASPVEHAILHGDGETGVTVMEMTEDLDAGPILSQERAALSGRETAVELKQRLATLGASLLRETLKQPLRRIPQSHEGVTICRRLQRQDGIVDPGKLTAEEIDRRVRALTPWPGVTTTIGGCPTKLIATSLTPSPDSAVLPCAGGTLLYLTQVQVPGRRVLNGSEWERGRRK